MQERLESVGVKPEMAAILSAIIKIRYNGDAPDDPIEALRLFGGYIASIATKLDSIVPPTYTNLCNGNQVVNLSSDDYEELNDAQENAVEELTENQQFYAEWDDIEIDSRIEELNERNELNGAQMVELLDLEQEQDRRREDADPDDDSDVEGGQPAILQPPPPVNPHGPAPANAVPLDSDLNLILTV